MPLVRLSVNDDLFGKLENQWRNQARRFGWTLEDYAPSHLRHAREIAAETPPDKKYGVFALKRRNSYECLMHINNARVKGTDGVALRILWVLLAPKYDFQDVDIEDLARLNADIVTEVVRLSNEDWQADEIKLHLNGLGDRRFFAGVAYGLKTVDRFKDVAIKGNWLHITKA